MTPHGRWSAPQGRMRWSFEELVPGHTGIAIVSFAPPGQVPALLLPVALCTAADQPLWQCTAGASHLCAWHVLSLLSLGSWLPDAPGDSSYQPAALCSSYQGRAQCGPIDHQMLQD